MADDMDQSDIDALLNGIGGDESADSSSEEAAPGGEIDQSDIDAMFDSAPAATPEPPADGPLEQDNIDALFDSASSAPSEPPADGPLEQDNIDALFENASAATPEPPADDGPLAQDNIDALLASVEGAPQEEGDASADMDALLAEMPAMGQDEGVLDIDNLLNEIQPESSSTGATATQDDIDALMNTVADSGMETDMPVVEEEQGVNVDFLLDMKLTITFEVGRARMLIGDLLSLGQGSVIELHRLVGEDLDMFVHGRLIAKGEVVVVNEKFGVRILDIVSPADRIKNMSGMDSLV